MTFFYVAAAAADPPTITNVEKSGNNVTLWWDVPTNAFIVEAYDSVFSNSCTIGSASGDVVNVVQVHMPASNAFFRIKGPKLW